MAMSCSNFLPILFADDTNLITSHSDFTTLINNVNHELSTVEKWFQLNKLTLNIKKCNFIIFCNVNKSFPIEKAKIYMNNIEIELVQSTKFLGVIIDNNLSWSYHVDLVSKRSSRMLGILRKVCPLIHSSAHLTLYYSFLFPFINYCNIVWAATNQSYLKKKVMTIQKQFLRLISHSCRYAPSAPLFTRYNILPIDKVNTYLICLFIHKFIYSKHDLPIALQNLFTHTSDRHNHHTRHSVNTLVIPRTRTSKPQLNITYRGPKLWSELSLSLRSMSSFPAFKKHLKIHLMSA